MTGDRLRELAHAATPRPWSGSTLENMKPVDETLAALAPDMAVLLA